MPAATPAEVRTLPSSTYSARGSTVTAGYSRASRAAYDQCVVARRPSSTPAAASTKAPVQIETRRAPRAAAAARAASTAPAASPGCARPGTTIVSARASASRPCSMSSAGPPSTGTGPGASVHTVTAYGPARQLPKAWTGIP